MGDQHEDSLCDPPRYCDPVGCTGVWADNTSPTVQTNSGEVIGQVEKSSDGESVYSFKGIPYAQAARWESPEDPAPWSEPLDATKYGAQCAQPSEEYQNDVMGYKNLTKYDVGFNDDIVFPDIETSEDCLFLNVFTPSLNESSNGAPVMVWIHGGSLFTGTGATYSPEDLAAKGVVVVTINYRLGLLGYFAYPDLNGTNFGLQDQVKALEWVKNNIADFGGNPDQVTIFGESAGAGSVLALMVSPLSEGLEARFHMYLTTRVWESFPIQPFQIPCRLTGSNLLVLAIQTKSPCHNGRPLTERIGRSLVLRLRTQRFLLNMLSSTILVDLPLLQASINCKMLNC